MTSGRDRISQLPADILDHILGFLPIQDAAKTTVISSFWIDVWPRLTHINFDSHFFSYIDKNHNIARKYVWDFAVDFHVINKVLLKHNGTIQKFVLDFSIGWMLGTSLESFDDFNQCLLLVTQKGVEEINLRFAHKIYRLPNCIFSCLALKRLHLYSVIVQPMNFPSILPNVTSLYFEYVDFRPISPPHCAIDIPILENLSFRYCQNMFNFNITAPKLCSLTVKYCFSHGLDKFLPINLCFRPISTLELEGSYLQDFVKEFNRMGFQLNVEYLKVSCYFHESDSSSTFALVHLLRLCPKLCKLDINLFPLDVMARKRDAFLKLLSELHDMEQANKMLHSLKLINFRGLQSEILFIKELLANFSALEKVFIVNHEYRCEEYFRNTEELLQLPRAFTKAEIIFV